MLAYEIHEMKKKSCTEKILLGFYNTYYLLKDITKVDSFTHNNWICHQFHKEFDQK